MAKVESNPLVPGWCLQQVFWFHFTVTSLLPNQTELKQPSVCHPADVPASVLSRAW